MLTASRALRTRVRGGRRVLATALPDLAHVDGSWVPARSGATMDVVNPSTLDVLGSVPEMGREDAEAAVAAAGRAQLSFRATTVKERASYLRAIASGLREGKEDLARLLSLESGKPLAEARGEIEYGATFFDWFAEEAPRAYGVTLPVHDSSRRMVTIKQGVGVCALITPWNFPNAMIARKLAPAIAAGCASVIKPAEDTPLSALALADVAHKAGLPPGTVNVVTTSRALAPEVGLVLSTSPTVRKLSFTGSTAVGKQLAAQSASTVKRVSLELGGNAPFIVFDDADVEAAVKGAMASKFRNTGQTCVCANRLFVQEGIYDAFAERLAAEVATLRPGHGGDEGVTQGPLINDRAIDKVEAHVQDAVGRGARVVAGGGRLAELGPNFFDATVLADVTREMQVYREETFGPVAPLFKFRTEDEAVELANDTTAGLASYCYTRDVGRAWRMAEKLEYGMVGMNEGIISAAAAPFGGVKESGLGREGGDVGLDEYLNVKLICLGGIGQ